MSQRKFTIIKTFSKKINPGRPLPPRINLK